MRDLDPHIYALAEHAHHQMTTTRRSQTLICTGESGAGKTVGFGVPWILVEFFCFSRLDTGFINVDYSFTFSVIAVEWWPYCNQIIRKITGLRQVHDAVRDVGVEQE